MKRQARDGSVLICGARLCEPQRVALQITPLRVTDPRSEGKLGHCPRDTTLFNRSQSCHAPAKE